MKEKRKRGTLCSATRWQLRLFLYISLPSFLLFFIYISHSFARVFARIFSDTFGDFSLLSPYFFHFVPPNLLPTSLNFLRIFLFTNVRGFRLNLAVLRLHESDPHESLPFHLLLFSTTSSNFSRIVVLSCCFTLPNNILSFSLFLSCL